MKIAVLSDIHSNYHAFLACVEYALKQGVRQFLFLGDYVSDCAYPQKTMELLYELQNRYQCWFIRGNREEYLLNYRKSTKQDWKIPSSATGSLLYTLQNLEEKDLQFFDAMAITGRIMIEDFPEFWFCHGSMEEAKGDLSFESENFTRTMKHMSSDLLICGHTHLQGSYQWNHKKLVNVGSVGIPWNYGGKAQFGILHGNRKKWEMELLQLPYQREKTIKELYESHLNQKANIWIRLVEETLKTGIDRSEECLQIALKKYLKNENCVSWTNLPEEHWEAAAKELGLLS